MKFDHPALPPPVSRPWLVGVLSIWFWAVVWGSAPATPLAAGWVEAEGVAVTSVRESRYGRWVLVTVDQGVVLLELGEDVDVTAGERVGFTGVADGQTGAIAGREHIGSVEVFELRRLAGDGSLTRRLGAAMKQRVLAALEPMTGGRALLAGFLIGEIDGLSTADLAAMRRSGLAHFVAVSGSNVALYLGLVFVVAGPLAMSPKRRAGLGLAALPVYVAATGFEPSVLRAAAMAALALGGSLLGVVFETWQLLALAVSILMLAEPELATSLGFQLSVAATAGVVVGARWPLRGGKVRRALAVTLGAQLAVAPLLLVAFGAVPLLSPLANLLAAPLVAASTVLGAVGVAGLSPLVGLASWLAEAVLWLARGASVWPQIGPWILLGAVVLGIAAIRYPASRAVVATSAAGLLLVLVLGIGNAPPSPGVVVLDVGQGDAILIHGSDGRFALVDGGPDALRLLDGLRRYGVRHLELVVLTHVHADHATGLIDLARSIPVGRVWASLDPHETEASLRALAGFETRAVPVVVPVPGDGYRLGELELVVVGPLRPYASPNDQSVVIMVQGPGSTMLLAGDIETIAQRELSDLRADVLKVPHQGAATSDPDWLQEIGADLAVISVGPNLFGHPDPGVIQILESSGARVLRTDQHGDVLVPLG